MPHPSATCSCPAAGPPRPARLSLILAPSGALGPKVAGLFGTSSAGRWRSGQPGSQACLSSVFPGAAEWGILAWRAHDSGRLWRMGAATKARVSPFTSPQPDVKDEPRSLSAGTGGVSAKAPPLVFIGYIVHKWRVTVQRQGPPRVHLDCCSQTPQPSR